MRLALLRRGGPDGTLAVVDRDLRRCAAVPDIAPTLQMALDDWTNAEPRLKEAASRLAAGTLASEPFDTGAVLAPLPRAWQFLDGSAYLSHVELARRARGADMPPEMYHEPLMYQGCSAPFLAPCNPIPLGDPAWGLDYEGEIAVVTGDVPAGADRSTAAAAIRLLMLLNDVSLRGLIPQELAKGFGFLQGKPPSAQGPVVITPDEAGAAWDGGRLTAALVSHVNGREMGRPDAGADMHFDFPALIAHAARTRPLPAGTVIGAGTVSNHDRSRGFACLVERRMWEKLTLGEVRTPFLAVGDVVRLEALTAAGDSLFGTIEQRVVGLQKK